jgi:hypothetical protein
MLPVTARPRRGDSFLKRGFPEFRPSQLQLRVFPVGHSPCGPLSPRPFETPLNHRAVQPPSTSSVAPVTNDDSEEAKNKAAQATSSGLPRLAKTLIAMW